MKRSIKISIDSSCNDWQILRSQILLDLSNRKLWESAIALFEDRINTRYLNQIDLIHAQKKFTGEGFAIMTIICSLIEFLEATVQGVTYRYCKDSDLKPFEYNRSAELFVSFLTTRKPFQFDKKLANEFYTDVRCGLLHEARTKNNWVIRVDSAKLIYLKDGMRVINRTIFDKRIRQFLILYKKKLTVDLTLKEAFIRKMDNLCN